MFEMHLKETGFTYSACETFTQSKERIQNVKIEKILDIFIKTK